MFHHRLIIVHRTRILLPDHTRKHARHLAVTKHISLQKRSLRDIHPRHLICDLHKVVLVIQTCENVRVRILRIWLHRNLAIVRVDHAVGCMELPRVVVLPCRTAVHRFLQHDNELMPEVLRYLLHDELVIVTEEHQL